jgi:hypothetical protein
LRLLSPAAHGRKFSFARSLSLRERRGGLTKQPAMKLSSLVLGLCLAVAATLVLPPAAARAEDPATFDVAGFTFTRPADWQWVNVTSAMRKAQLRVGKPEDEAEITFFHFTGAGGDVESNTRRWLGQFKSKEGAEKVEAKTLNGVKVTFVTTEGTFSSGMPGGPVTPKNDFALIGAIMEAKEGSVFVKFTGPEKVVKGARDKFVQFITEATTAKK